MKNLLFIISFLFISCSNKNTYYWSSETRDYCGIYDPKKISKKQIDNIYQLCYSSLDCFSNLALNEEEGMLDYTGIKDETDESILNEYINSKNEIEKIDILPIPFWQNIKSKKIEEIKYKFELKKNVLESFKNPKVLYSNKFSNICHEYVDMANISDEDKLLKEWEKLFSNIDNDKEYAEQHIKFFYEKFTNPKERFIKAREEIIIFGYWHHTLEKLCIENHVNTSKEFEKLFIEVSSYEKQ